MLGGLGSPKETGDEGIEPRIAAAMPRVYKARSRTHGLRPPLRPIIRARNPLPQVTEWRQGVLSVG